MPLWARHQADPASPQGCTAAHCLALGSLISINPPWSKDWKFLKGTTVRPGYEERMQLLRTQVNQIFTVYFSAENSWQICFKKQAPAAVGFELFLKVWPEQASVPTNTAILKPLIDSDESENLFCLFVFTAFCKLTSGELSKQKSWWPLPKQGSSNSGCPERW